MRERVPKRVRVCLACVCVRVCCVCVGKERNGSHVAGEKSRTAPTCSGTRAGSQIGNTRVHAVPAECIIIIMTGGSGSASPLALSPSSRVDTLSSVARRGVQHSNASPTKNTPSRNITLHTQETRRGSLVQTMRASHDPRPLPQYRACRPIPPGGHHKKPWKRGFPSGVHDRWSQRFPPPNPILSQRHPVLL